MKISGSLTNWNFREFSHGDMHSFTTLSMQRTTERELVHGVLQILQGLSNPLFFWDHDKQQFCVKSGVYVSHLSHSSLKAILNQLLYTATCLQLVHLNIGKLEVSSKGATPIIRAFSCSVAAWIKKLRDTASQEEEKLYQSNMTSCSTLLGLTSNLSSLCSGAEYLLQVVHGAIPDEYFESNCTLPTAQVTVDVLDYLYTLLNEVYLVQGSEEEPYKMILSIFVQSLLPYVEVLDSWIHEGLLDDPFEEMFFLANRSVSVDDAEFWKKSYSLRFSQSNKLASISAGTDSAPHVLSMNEKVEMDTDRMTGWNDNDNYACPVFLRDLAKSIVSAGKSLQLIQHTLKIPSCVYVKQSENDVDISCSFGGDNILGMAYKQVDTRLTLAEGFCLSLASFVGHSYILPWQIGVSSDVPPLIGSDVGKNSPIWSSKHILSSHAEKLQCRLLFDGLTQKRNICLQLVHSGSSDIPSDRKRKIMGLAFDVNSAVNPVISVCSNVLNQNLHAWDSLNISRNFHPPSLSDDLLSNTIYNDKMFLTTRRNQMGGREYFCSQDTVKELEKLFPFPTLLPFLQEDFSIPALLPFQNNSTLSSSVLNWMRNAKLKATLPPVLVQECLTGYIRKQVNYIGTTILSFLREKWRLMDELGVLRAVYFLGSGDLLQHFLAVIFNKLEKEEESWDDDFELNTILQESIRYSSDRNLLCSPDSLVVSISKQQQQSSDVDTNRVATTVPLHFHRNHNFALGMDRLVLLKFNYKVSWPLELIANAGAMEMYNQVMSFLLKVKRAKHVLDKVRRWLWKDNRKSAIKSTHHWLVEQKLLHFVDAFHQYVMDRVYHSAWHELCEQMAAAKSLDEVIEIHGSYLCSVQRQCFVVPDKLGAMIASRINSILALALDFYSVQQSLSSSGAVSAINAGCEAEIDRIEKQFDDCIAFILRVLSLKLNAGNFPHLADLVTRINFNCYYMCDGNLINAPSAQSVSSKLAQKAFN